MSRREQARSEAFDHVTQKAAILLDVCELQDGSPLVEFPAADLLDRTYLPNIRHGRVTIPRSRRDDIAVIPVQESDKHFSLGEDGISPRINLRPLMPALQSGLGANVGYARVTGIGKNRTVHPSRPNIFLGLYEDQQWDLGTALLHGLVNAHDSMLADPTTLSTPQHETYTQLRAYHVGRFAIDTLRDHEDYSVYDSISNTKRRVLDAYPPFESPSAVTQEAMDATRAANMVLY